MVLDDVLRRLAGLRVLAILGVVNAHRHEYDVAAALCALGSAETLVGLHMTCIAFYATAPLVALPKLRWLELDDFTNAADLIRSLEPAAPALRLL